MVQAGELSDQAVGQRIDVPILANITEFGKTPLYTKEELASAGIGMVLYPLSATRAMCQAALEVYKEIRSEGTQKACIEQMQTRDELYQFLGYHAYEEQLDKILSKEVIHD